MLTLALLVVSTTSHAADTLPERIENPAFWKLVETLSEESGTFQSDNLLSNETDFPYIMAELQRMAKTDGVFLGVGPEQSFNYIAALHPKMAFIIDIRRQNMLEHLMYKALFELSPDRASFVSRLFSRRQPEGLSGEATAAEIFEAFADVPAESALFRKNLADIEKVLIESRHFPISSGDRAYIEKVYDAFREFGPLINYNSAGGVGTRRFMPSYSELMTAVDFKGQEWSYLASEASYETVRNLENRNLIVPVTGDFGGSRAIRGVGQYLKDHAAMVSAFYTSNVEGYLFQGGDRQGNPNGGARRFYENVATLPLDDSSTFIRWVPGFSRNSGTISIVLAPMQATIDDFHEGRFTGVDLSQGNGFGYGLTFRNNVPAQRSIWVARLRILFYSSWALMGFLIRYFIWGSARTERFSSPRRILSSLAWGAGGFALALILGSLSRV